MSIGRIELVKTLPCVFQHADVCSELWLRNVAFEKGKNYLVEAASGTGKSSLCAYIYGSRTDYLGDIKFDDRNIRSLALSEWQSKRRAEIAYLPQELSLFPELSALQNVELKNNLTQYASHQKIVQWFEALGIANRMDYPTGKMSIGQQQRVAVIRALCQPFSFLLLDEPVSHLDSENNKTISRIIVEEAERQGAAIIVTSVGNNLQIKYDTVLSL